MGRLILKNARVRTLDPGLPEAWGVEIEDGIVTRVLPERTSPGRRTGDTVIDLRGLTLMPAFADAHVHLRTWAIAREAVDLAGTRSLEATLDRLRAGCAGLSPGAWLRATRWNRNDWDEPRWPDRVELDSACPNTPALVESLDLHSCWLNSLALEAAGLSGDLTGRSLPEGLEVRKEGKALVASGIVREELAFSVMRQAPPPSPTALERRMREVCAWLGRKGVSAVSDMDGLEAAEWLSQLALPLRIRASVLARELQPAMQRGLRAGSRLGRRVVLGPLKLFLDGSLGSRTAWMLEPWEGEATETGAGSYQFDSLLELGERALAGGWELAIHAIGDRANRQVLDLYERLRPLHPGAVLRVEHAQILSERDLPRFASLGALASVQPSHLRDDVSTADKHWGRRARLAYPLGSLVRAGAKLAFGSDVPVGDADPRVGLDAALNRRDRAGLPPGGWYPGEKLDRHAALLAATAHAQEACGLANRAGRLAPGWLADLIAVEGDPWSTPPLELEVRATWIGGEAVHQKV
jgi:predicted amidohydrolase YtcJ